MSAATGQETTTVRERIAAAVEAERQAEREREDVIAEVRRAGRYVAACTRQELELEERRPLIKRDAIKRLMESGAAASATAAEKIVEQDAEYAAHRAQQIDAVCEKIMAWAEYEAARLRATLAVEQATQGGAR